MNMQRPFEGLLRPPFEWFSALASLSCATLVFMLPQIFMLPELLAQMMGVGLMILAVKRFYDGYKIWRYQRRLKRMPKYSMTSAQLPVSERRLFIGKGFAWTPLHTQRLRDLDLGYNLKYCQPSVFYQWAREFEMRYEKTFFLKYFAKVFRSDNFFNPVRPWPEIGGEPKLHGVSETENDIYMTMNERAGHTVVVGTTGVGKTRLAELLISQDIRRGDVVIVLDPKGDADLLKRMIIEAEICARKNDLLIFHLGFPKVSARYNPIGQFTKITQVAARITNGLPSSGDAASFKEFAWKYVNLVARSLVILGLKPTYQLISRYITNMQELFTDFVEQYFPTQDAEFESWIKNYIFDNTVFDKNRHVKSQPTRSMALLAYAKYHLVTYEQDKSEQSNNDLIRALIAACTLDKTYYDKITASVGPLLEKLTTGEIAELLSPDENNLEDARPVFDWMQVIRQKKIVYIGMDAMTDSVISSAVGNAMLADLVSVAGHLYKFGLHYGYENLNLPKEELPNVFIHADEFNEIIGDEFIPILNKARGAGFNVTAYTQTWSDVLARVNSQAKAGQVAGNFNNFVMLRTKEEATVKMLLSQLPTVPILRAVPASSSSDTPMGEQGVFYASSNEDRFAYTDLRLVEQNDVLNLPKGQAFALLKGGQLFKLRLPLPKNDDSAHLSNDIALLIASIQLHKFNSRGKS